MTYRDRSVGRITCIDSKTVYERLLLGNIRCEMRRLETNLTQPKGITLIRQPKARSKHESIVDHLILKDDRDSNRKRGISIIYEAKEWERV